MRRRMGTTDPEQLLDDVLSRAIPKVRAAAIDVFTFAFYHDHESSAVSVCVDTEASSARLVLSQRLVGRLRSGVLVDDGAGRRLARRWSGRRQPDDEQPGIPLLR